MNISLNPGEYFTIFRGLSDHTDSTTYYVRAIVKNIRTNTTITTINLTDLGSRQFKTDWQVPADTSGNGFWIGIVTEVYTDSSYTTRATSYLDEFETYLVFDRRNPLTLGGNGGGADIDYEKIDKIVAKHANAIEIPEQKEVDLRPVFKAILEVKQLISSIKMPTFKQKETDLSLVYQGLDTIQELILAIEMPEMPELDLSPVIEKLEERSEDFKNHVTASHENIGKITSDAIGKLSSNENQTIQNIRNLVNDLPLKQKEEVKNDDKKVNKKRPFLNIED